MTAILWVMGITFFLLSLFWLWALMVPVRSLPTADWQKPVMAENNIRRAVGFIPAFLLFILFNPPWREEANPAGLVLGIIFAGLGYIYLNPGNIFFVPFRKYIKWYRIWSPYGNARQVMAFRGEAGWQPHKRLQGTRYVIVAWNQIGIFRYTHVPANAVWYLRSRVGGVLRASRKTADCMPSKYGNQELEAMYFYEHPAAFMAVGGQLNIQRNIITPGYFGPIDLIAVEVDDGTLPDSQPSYEKDGVKHDYYIPFRIPDDKFGMVTCLDSSYPMPEGAIFARLGGFDDIEKVIVGNLGKDEVDTEYDEEALKGVKDLFVGEKKPQKREPALGDDYIIAKYNEIFRYEAKPERTVAGECLRLLLQGPQVLVEDYQNIRVFDDLKGTVGPHWRLIRPGRLLNLNRFVLDISLVDPLIVEPGTVEVLILSTGTLARDITERAFKGGKIVRMGGHGINVKALEPAHYPIPGYKKDEGEKQFKSVRVRRKGEDGKDVYETVQIPKIEHIKVGQLATFVTIPTRQLSLFFKSNQPTSVYDADLNTIKERSKDGIWVVFDFNVLLTIPAESAAVIVAAYGDPMEFITRVVATITYGVTVEYIRTNDVKDIVIGTVTPETAEEKPGEKKILEPRVISVIEEALRAAVQEKLGVIVDKVKLEHFEAEAYLEKLELQAIAQAEEKAVIAQTKVAEERKKLKLAEGEAVANFVAAKAKGDAEAIKVTYMAMVEQFGKEGATAIQAFKEMTSGKHPFMPTVLGVAGNDTRTSGLVPSAAMLGGILSGLTDRLKTATELAAKSETKTDESEAKPQPKETKAESKSDSASEVKDTSEIKPEQKRDKK